MSRLLSSGIVVSLVGVLLLVLYFTAEPSAGPTDNRVASMFAMSAVPALAGLLMAAGAALIGIGAGDWRSAGGERGRYATLDLGQPSAGDVTSARVDLNHRSPS